MNILQSDNLDRLNANRVGLDEMFCGGRGQPCG